jgi:hypothetical protein
MKINKMVAISYETPEHSTVVGGLTEDSEIIYTIREAIKNGAKKIFIDV